MIPPRVGSVRKFVIMILFIIFNFVISSFILFFVVLKMRSMSMAAALSSRCLLLAGLDDIRSEKETGFQNDLSYI